MACVAWPMLFRARGERIDWCITGEPSSKHALGDLLRSAAAAPCRRR